MAKRRKKSRPASEVNSSSMADIAFLLLIFFLVTTTVVTYKGIDLVLPKKVKNEEKDDDEILKRNVLQVLLNSNNQLLVNGELMQFDDLKKKTKTFITNNGVDPDMSESPQEAIVSFRIDRGTQYKYYVQTIDALVGAYNELHANVLKMSVDEFLALDQTDPEDNNLLKVANAEYPRVLSEAEPSDFN